MANSLENRIINFLRLLKEARLSIGYSCENMAEELEMSTSAYHKLETGKAKIKLEKFISICEILELNPTVILGFEVQKLTDDSELVKKLNAKIERMYERNMHLSAKLIDQYEKKTE